MFLQGLKSSQRGRECWLFYFNSVIAVMCVSMSLLRIEVGRFMICVCCIVWSYSLVFEVSNKVRFKLTCSQRLARKLKLRS